MKNPKVVAFDLDGTLAISKQQLTPHMGELLSALLAKVPVAIMSGAGFPQFRKQVFPMLPPDAKLDNLYIFPTNAAQCYAYRNATWSAQYDHAFTEEEKELVLQVVGEGLGIVGLQEEPDEVWGERIEDRGAQISFSPLGQQAPVSKKEEWAKLYNPKRIALHAYLVRELPDFAVAMGGITTIDITRKGITKAFGVRQLSEITHVPIPEMVYVGDALQEGGNDAVVIETGIPIQAVTGVEDTAAYITSIVE